MDEVLLELLDEARAETRTSSRQRESRLRQVAEESAELAGTLLDLAEHRAGVSIRTAAGRSHHGVLRLVGADFAVLEGSGDQVWVSLGAMTTVRPDPAEHHAPAAGSRPSVDLLFVEALARLVPERPRLAFVTHGGELVAGELRAVGVDVLTLRLDGGGTCYLSMSAIGSVLRSG